LSRKNQEGGEQGLFVGK